MHSIALERLVHSQMAGHFVLTEIVFSKSGVVDAAASVLFDWRTLLVDARGSDGMSLTAPVTIVLTGGLKL